MSSSKALFDKMPAYRGLPSESLGDFFLKFKSLATFENWDDATQCRKIMAFLSGRALRAYNDFPSDTTNNWGHLKQALVDKFQPPGYSNVWQAAWTTPNQLPGESAPAYLDSLRSLAKDTFPAVVTEEGREEVVRARFLAGLATPIATFLNIHQPTATLDELEIAVNNYETGQKLAQGIKQIVPQQEMDKNRVFAGFALHAPPSQDYQFLDSVSSQLGALHLSPSQGQVHTVHSSHQHSSSSSHGQPVQSSRGRRLCSRFSHSHGRGPPQWTSESLSA